jgi:ribosomal protein S18 acetylase RimI-like enzyme
MNDSPSRRDTAVAVQIRPFRPGDGPRLVYLVRDFCQHHRDCEPLEAISYVMPPNTTVAELVDMVPEAYLAFQILSSGPDEPLQEAIARYADRPGMRWFLAEVDGVVEGFALAAVHDTEPFLAFRRAGHLDSAYVAPAMRRRGIVRALNEAVLAWMREQGTEVAHLDVLDRNKVGLAAWAGVGYRPHYTRMTRDL